MPIASGTRLGSYEIVAAIGAGGMGEVYRAIDTKLKRQVAIKILPPSLAADHDRLARFQREAEVLASLNHPNIAAIYGIEDAGDTRALVMELVEGEDLSTVIGRGPIPLTDALPIARQIADALEAAHGQGTIHRDLKPANIKIKGASARTSTRQPDGHAVAPHSASDIADGTVKVLDFGLAKALSPVGATGAAAGDLANSPTITSPAMTEKGLILGTAAYMAPEQARGRVVDKRADIWAFGVVLFEMLTGTRAFPGEDATDTLAAVLQREPDWHALPAATPAAVRRLLGRCLEKDPKRRLHDIADARIEIDEARSGAREVAMVPPAASRTRGVLTWGLTVVVASVAAAAAGWFLRPVPVAREARLEITTPPTFDPAFAMSPDGRKVAVVASSDGPMQLWVRSLDDGIARPLRGTANGTLPFWSPDGKSIGFFADSKLLRVDIEGGSVRALVPNAAVPLGGSWGTDGTILFASNPGGPIQRIPAEGGNATDVTRVEAPRERGHFSPQFLPGGRRFLFFMSGNPETTGIYVAELDTGRKTRLLQADGSARYVEPGYLVFPRGPQVLAQAFDADSATLHGEVITIADGLKGRIVLSVAPNGTVAYRTAPGDSGQRQLVWVDRAGREFERVVYDGSAAQSPALSHDGRHVAIFRFVNGNMDLWSYDRKRELWDRLTFDAGDDIYPLWSPDDRTMIFAGVRNAAPLGLYRRLISDPPERERPLLKAAAGEFPMDWSTDDRYLLFGRVGPKTGPDIWALSLTEPGREPFEVVVTDANEGLAQFSPDGKWIAYQSDKLGREEIYVRPFPGPGPETRVSSDGGIQARWNPKAPELFYIGADDRMMAVSITVKPDGTVDAGKPEALFPTTIGSTVRLKYRQQYVLSPDGKSFGLNSVVDQPRPSPIAVILNWQPARR